MKTKQKREQTEDEATVGKLHHVVLQPVFAGIAGVPPAQSQDPWLKGAWLKGSRNSTDFSGWAKRSAGRDEAVRRCKWLRGNQVYENATQQKEKGETIIWAEL
jgi:hypothetical protein